MTETTRFDPYKNFKFQVTLDGATDDTMDLALEDDSGTGVGSFGNDWLVGGTGRDYSPSAEFDELTLATDDTEMAVGGFSDVSGLSTEVNAPEYN